MNFKVGKLPKPVAVGLGIMLGLLLLPGFISWALNEGGPGTIRAAMVVTIVVTIMLATLAFFWRESRGWRIGVAVVALVYVGAAMVPTAVARYPSSSITAWTILATGAIAVFMLWRWNR